MKNLISFFLFFLILFPFPSIAQIADISIGRTVTINSEVLNEKREILINLPLGYDANSAEYPVLYVLDGAAHFLHAVGTTFFLSNNGIIPQTIVVGIPNTVRQRDFTPTVSKQVPNSGGGDKFLSFMEDELIPYIDENYRTVPFRILFGHSLTAMYSIYTMLKQPDLFNAHISASPFVMYDKNYVINYAEKNLSESFDKNKFLYLTIGNEPNYFEHIDNLTKIFKEKSPENFTWEYQDLPYDEHGTVSLKTIYQGLEMIYQGWRLPLQFAQNGTLDDVKDHYETLSEKYDYDIKIPEAQLNILGYQVMAQDRKEEALKIFRHNVDLYPESANVYDSLGEGLEAADKLEEAKENYRIAIEKAEVRNDPNLPIFKQHLENVLKKMASN